MLDGEGNKNKVVEVEGFKGNTWEIGNRIMSKLIEIDENWKEENEKRSKRISETEKTFNFLSIFICVIIFSAIVYYFTNT